MHIPFCSALCPYCDFAVVVGRTDAHERYIDAVLRELAAEAWSEPFDTIFFGGGTPTFLDPALLVRVLEAVPRAPDAEVSVEANPDSVDLDAMKVLAEAGTDRVSIGAQSFVEHVLAALGRTHSPDDIIRAVETTRAAGIDNVSLDLIYGGPGEGEDDWETSVRAAVALEPTHVSCYALTIEERTPFGTAVARGAMRAPEDDVLADRFESACRVLDNAGFEHYEVSNWARPGLRCRHNMTYWTQGDYLGLGIGAHSHRDGHRWWNTRSLSRYMNGAVRDGEEFLGERARAEEWLSLRVRLADGFDVHEAERRFGPQVQPVIDELVHAGVAARDATTVRLTARGMLLDNEVTARLLQAGMRRRGPAAIPTDPEGTVAIAPDGTTLKPSDTAGS